VTGASLYPDWFPKWALDYCLQNSAMIVAADYRLMPECNGSDIMEDLSDFWTWVRDGLQSHLSTVRPGIEADLEKVIAYGESAGGTLAIQSGFVQPPGFIKAVIAAYPGLNSGVKRAAPIMGAPTIPPNILEEFLKSIEPGKIVTSAEPPARMHIALSIAQQGRTLEFFGADERLFPVSVLQTLDDMPFVLILHGKDDTAVPVEGSVRFAELVRQKFGSGKVDLRIEPGEHGFDGSATLDMPWLKEGLNRVTELWLGKTKDSR
jgi:acetyl esterase/lipase